MTLILRCQQCQSTNLLVLPGKGSHHAELRCQPCDRHIRWLSQYQAKTFARHLPSSAAQPSEPSQGELEL